ncbi:MAG: aspartate kinase [Solirubrobacteraceae bacterium]
MKIFKFGGASVKDSSSVKNVVKVLKTIGFENTFMVFSAMGKTTNALEEVVQKYFAKENFEDTIQEIKDFHTSIAKELFEDVLSINSEINNFFLELTDFLKRNKSPNYNYVYDQVVCCGELISTKIVATYLNYVNIPTNWIDVREFIKTDSTYREGKVNWKKTKIAFQNLDKNTSYLTQGFIGSDENGFTVTLGREGSDYTAAIIAYCLEAESMTIWKDVSGVLNADPRYFSETQLLNHISYEEAIELAFYGASVIHPKTMQPLQKKGIPFFVKSFIDPLKNGTSVKNGVPLEPYVPCFIVKKNNILLTASTKDFSFIAEDSLSQIFMLLSKYSIKVSLMQISAISLSLVLEDKFNNIALLHEDLKENYIIQLINNVSLYTVRHFNNQAKETAMKGKIILLEQIIKETLQLVVKE